MKEKVFMMLFLAFFAMLAVSCGKNAEREVNGRIEALLEEKVCPLDGVELDDFETVYANDSVVIIHFKLTSYRKDGAAEVFHMEYAYMHDYEDVISECVRVLELMQPMMDEAKELYKRRIEKTPNRQTTLTECLNKCIEREALFSPMGRMVDADGRGCYAPASDYPDEYEE